MSLPTFIGGVHPPGNKELSSDSGVVAYKPSGRLVFPMSQHLGAPCSPIVKKGDRVLVGQKIADSDAFVSAPILSSVSGTVADVALHMTIPGTLETCVIVDDDGLGDRDPGVVPRSDYMSLEPKEYLKIIREAGIVGMGGACFPTAVKLSPPPDREIKWLIVNGAECEPFLNCDNRLMLEEPDKIVEGLRICKRLFPSAQGIVAIENNKLRSIEAMERAVSKFEGENLSVTPLTVKYPQGAEKMLIYSLTGQEIPVGVLPADVGCIILNVRTVYQIWLAVTQGMPLVERIITVTGDVVGESKNILTPLGVSVQELIDFCGGFVGQPAKVLSGGPMMGISMRSLDVPVVKGTSGILALSAKSGLLRPESACLRCGRCIDACPMGLQPSMLDKVVRMRDYEAFEAGNGMSCLECGCCTYACPACRFLTQSCRDGKAGVNAARRRAKEKEKEAVKA